MPAHLSQSHCNCYVVNAAAVVIARVLPQFQRVALSAKRFAVCRRQSHAAGPFGPK